MPDDLPEIGLSAGIENLDKFAQDAKKVQDSYRAMAEAEAQVQKASEQQVAAMDQVGVAAQAAAAQVKDAASAWDDIAADMGVAQTAAEEQSAAFASAGSGMDEFFKSAAALKQGVADVKGELQAWDAELSKQTLHIDDAASAQERLERAYQALEKESVEGAKMLREMGQAFVDSGGKVEKWADTVEDVFGEAIDGIEDDAQRATSAMEDMAKILSLGVITQAASTAGQLGDRLVGLAKDAVMTAARIEELDLVMGNLAEQNDLSTAAMREQVEAIRAQGIQADVAYSLVTQFVQANLDLSKASELARLAQDAAVISMEDSSQALAGLVHGITTLQPEVLRYRGILVDLQGEYQKWSEENNRAVQSMTSTEKQAVALNAALAQGATITGTYESAMTSASKQLRSMPRYVNDLKAEMGDALLPVYSDLIFATKDALKEMNSWPAATKAALAATGALTGGLLKGTMRNMSGGQKTQSWATISSQRACMVWPRGQRRQKKAWMPWP